MNKTNLSKLVSLILIFSVGTSSFASKGISGNTVEKVTEKVTEKIVDVQDKSRENGGISSSIIGGLLLAGAVLAAISLASNKIKCDQIHKDAFEEDTEAFNKYMVLDSNKIPLIEKMSFRELLNIWNKYHVNSPGFGDKTMPDNRILGKTIVKYPKMTKIIDQAMSKLFLERFHEVEDFWNNFDFDSYDSCITRGNLYQKYEQFGRYYCFDYVIDQYTNRVALEGDDYGNIKPDDWSKLVPRSSNTIDDIYEGKYELCGYDFSEHYGRTKFIRKHRIKPMYYHYPEWRLKDMEQYSENENEK